MEISNKVPSVYQTHEVQARKGKVKSAPAAQSATQGDRVQLSAQAKEMQAARQAIQQMPDVDLEKVAKIKAQIKSGSYKVNAQEIASKMIRESLISDNE